MKLLTTGWALLFCVLLVALPLLAMALETVAGPDGFTLEAFGQILADPVDREQLGNSMLLGVVATAIACALGFGHAWLCTQTDLPGGAWLGPLGVAPLVIPPIVVAMGFADLWDVAGFWACAGLLGVSYAPFVAVLGARGLRSIDARSFEAARLARGRGAAERLVLRMAAPEILAGCLFAFVFVVSEHGVPEFLTVKGKTWHTYAEGVFARWTRRATGVEHEQLVSPIVAALPLVAVIVVALVLALRLRAHTTVRGDFRPLPRRPLGGLRLPALLLPLVYLGAGIVLPVVVMARWAAGSTTAEPMAWATMREGFRAAVTEAGDDLVRTLLIGVATTAVLLSVALPLARLAARRTRGPWLEAASALPLAVPATVLGIGVVHVYNSGLANRIYGVVGDFYDSAGLVVAAYAARLLPFGVLTLSHAMRRIPSSLGEAAALSGRSPLAQALAVRGPLLLPAAWSAACLVLILAVRELDVAVVLPGGNGTVVRRLSNIVHFGGEEMGGALALLLLLAALLPPLLTVLLTGRRLRSLS